MIDADVLRQLAAVHQSGVVRDALNKAAERIDELTTMNRLLNLVGGMADKGHSSGDIVDLNARLSNIERQLPHFAELELTIEGILKRWGYTPRG